jgi:hypothetical protein
MPTFDIETEEITAFDTGDIHIFKTYFDENQLFKQLETYYNEDKYRFEIPDGDLEQVRQLLEEYYYELAVTDDIEEYCVVVEKKADSSDILRNSVMRKRRGQHEVLVMKDNLSKEQAIEKGAASLEKSGIQKEELGWKSP